ncbi:MAG: prolipoprotein diacylglyceryl transferase family protein [Candidatus Curtissbacteria bacterium]
MLATLANFSGLFYLAVVLLAVFIGVFLFWRAGRHELIDSELLLDSVIVAFFGGLVFGRIWDFLIRADRYDFSLSRLIFFNAFPGIDFAGILLGFSFATALFLRKKKVSFFEIFDLAVSKIAFAQSIISLGRFAIGAVFIRSRDLSALYFGLGYFLIFWVLARLSKRKRHTGFFTSLYLVGNAVLEIALFWTRRDVVYIGQIPYKLALGVALLAFSLIFWYVSARRNFRKDSRTITAAIFLSLMRLKRTVVSVEEIGNLARLLILFPYYLTRKILLVLKFLGLEIASGLADFLVILGLKKYR